MVDADVDLWSESGLFAVFGDLHRLFLCGNVGPGEGDASLEGAVADVVRGDIGVDDHHRVVVDLLGGFEAGGGGFHRAAESAHEVGFPAGAGPEIINVDGIGYRKGGG